MKKYRSYVSIIVFALFAVSAVTGFVIYFMPHPKGPRPEVVDAVRTVSFGLVMKKTHEYASMVMAAAALFHIYLNWNSMKSYIFGKNK